MKALKLNRIIKTDKLSHSNALKISSLIILMLTVVESVGCSLLQKSDKPKHIYPCNAKHTLTDFSEEEEKSILDAFNIVIPDEEGEAKVTAFYFNEERNTYGGVLAVEWTSALEIDGVKDYESFFEANILRVRINEIDGLSLNELFEHYPPEYYITYLERYTDYPEESVKTDQADEKNKKMLADLKKCYDDISEKRKESGV